MQLSITLFIRGGIDLNKLLNGWVLVGSEYLPDDLILSFEEIRNWAYRTGLIWNEDLQIVDKNTIN